MLSMGVEHLAQAVPSAQDASACNVGCSTTYGSPNGGCRVCSPGASGLTPHAKRALSATSGASSAHAAADATPVSSSRHAAASAGVMGTPWIEAAVMGAGSE